MEPKEFKQLLTGVFGGRGKLTKAAIYFDVSERTVRRWVTGEVPIPQWVSEKLIVEDAIQNPSELLAERGFEFTRLQMQEHDVEWAAIRDGNAVHIFHRGIVVAVGVWRDGNICSPLFQSDNAPMDLLNDSVQAAIKRHS